MKIGKKRMLSEISDDGIAPKPETMDIQTKLFSGSIF